MSREELDRRQQEQADRREERAREGGDPFAPQTPEERERLLETFQNAVENHPAYEDASAEELEELLDPYEASDDRKAQDFVSSRREPSIRSDDTATRSSRSSPRTDDTEMPTQPSMTDADPTPDRDDTPAQRSNERAHAMRGPDTSNTSQSRAMDGETPTEDLSDDEALTRLINDRDRTKDADIQLPKRIKADPVRTKLRKGDQGDSWDFLNTYQDFMEAEARASDARRGDDGLPEDIDADALRDRMNEYRDDDGRVDFEAMAPRLREPAARIELQDTLAPYQNDADADPDIDTLPETVQQKVRSLLSTIAAQTGYRPNGDFIDAARTYLTTGRRDTSNNPVPVVEPADPDTSTDLLVGAIWSDQVPVSEILDSAVRAVFFSLENDLGDRFRGL